MAPLMLLSASCLRPFKEKMKVWGSHGTKFLRGAGRVSALAGFGSAGHQSGLIMITAGLIMILTSRLLSLHLYHDPSIKINDEHSHTVNKRWRFGMQNSHWWSSSPSGPRVPQWTLHCGLALASTGTGSSQIPHRAVQ
jgi:hypothetical protein